MQVPLPEHRFVADSSSGQLRITIPVVRSWFSIIFLCAWLGGWYFGETSAIRELTSPNAKAPFGFLAFWLVGWTVGGLFAASSVVWQLFGQEVIAVSSGSLLRRIQVGGLGFTREYSMLHVHSLRVSAESC
jgi:hypothetical protein